MNGERAALTVFASMVLAWTTFVPAATTYQAAWASVDKHDPAPEWFQDAKFGIYFHWGVFSVPAAINEWYPRRMYDDGTVSGKVDAGYTHHKKTYGDPFGAWPYHKFIEGANNAAGAWTQFAPKLKSQGGKWDPEEFAQLISDAGAKFAGPVIEHHDGFSMWDSKVNEWNSVQKGPKLDLAKLYVDAFRKHGLKILSAMHHAYNFTGFYQYAPKQSDPSLKKLYGQLTSAEENQLWLDKLKEVVDQFQPDIVWQDFNLQAVGEKQRLEFLSYYYNKGIDWNKAVVTTFKYDVGFNRKNSVFDFERGGPADITTPYWLTDDCISSSSWAYRTGMSYYSTAAVLHALVDRVSKGGNVLLNFSPMADGTIPQAQKDLLLGIGGWLKKYGESIYSTRAWSVYGEGPTKMGGGSGFTSPKAGTGQDVRYTRAKDTSAIYVIFLGWPGNNATFNLTGVATGRIKLPSTAKVQLLAESGNPVSLKWTQDASGLKVTFPAGAPYQAMAYAVKIAVKIPVGVERGSRRETAVATRRIVDVRGAGVDLAVPKGARSVEIYDPGGKLLVRQELTVGSTNFRIEPSIVQGSAFVRFLP